MSVRLKNTYYNKWKMFYMYNKFIKCLIICTQMLKNNANINTLQYVINWNYKNIKT